MKARVISNINLKYNYYKIVLEAPEIAAFAMPGQFIEVRCNDTYEPFLRRPFSIHRVRVQKRRIGFIEILYEVVGKGTKILSYKKAGDELDVLGPLGAGFRYSLRDNGYVILVSGGIGVAPLVFLAEELMGLKRKPQIIVLIGAKTENAILCEKDFREIGCEIYIATDDGTRGYRGFVPALFKRFLKGIRYIIPEVYACGPEAMLRDVAHICALNRLRCQLSLETKMACGFGVCLGCVVKTKIHQGDFKKDRFNYRLVCKDGPVFDAEEIIFT